MSGTRVGLLLQHTSRPKVVKRNQNPGLISWYVKPRHMYSGKTPSTNSIDRDRTRISVLASGNED